MPKKTRERKIIAQYRRKLKLLNLNNLDTSITHIQEKKIIIPEKVVHKIREEDNTAQNLFFGDFKKSLKVIVFILVLEIALYFVRIK